MFQYSEFSLSKYTFQAIVTFVTRNYNFSEFKISVHIRKKNTKKKQLFKKNQETIPMVLHSIVDHSNIQVYRNITLCNVTKIYTKSNNRE